MYLTVYSFSIFEKLTSRMGLGMNFLESPDTHPGVDLGAGELGMPQQLLDIANIRTVLQHQGGASMPEEMTGTLDLNPGLFDVALHNHGVAIRMNLLALVA